MAMLPEISAMTAYARTVALAARLSSREQIRRHQDRQCIRLTQHALKTIPFYRKAGPRFEDFPIIDKALQQSRFEEFNQPGISLDEVIKAIEAGRDQVRGHFVGQSTGTSGNRGRFVISAAERFVWLGTIVAKTMPDALMRRRRVALALPGFSTLYRSAGRGSHIQLAFFDLALGIQKWRDDLVHFRADAIVAPPKVLRVLAEQGVLAGVEPFSGAEVLDPLDRVVIEHATGRKVREIYMATEGLFGVGCRHGTLHLAEDVVRFEWEALPGSSLVVPIVTDMVRRVQPMIRHRMNDLVELSDRSCPCGSAFQAVTRIHGRVDDLFKFDGPQGPIIVTPDILRNAVVDADPRIDDFRIRQRRDGHVVVSLDAALPDEVHDKARLSLEKVLRRLGAEVLVEAARGMTPRFDRKLRRVEREGS